MGKPATLAVLLDTHREWRESRVAEELRRFGLIAPGATECDGRWRSLEGLTCDALAAAFDRCACPSGDRLAEIVTATDPERALVFLNVMRGVLRALPGLDRLEGGDAEQARHRLECFFDRAQGVLVRSLRRYRDSFTSAPVGLCHVDAAGGVVEANAAFATFLQRAPDDLGGRRFGDLVEGDAETLAALQEMLAGKTDSFAAELRFRRGDDRTVWGDIAATRSATADPSDPVLVAVHDVQARKQVEQAVARLAYFDPLTGLPNRRMFLDRLNQAVARLRRTGIGFALHFLDLDHFKVVNDTLGHQVGDRLLQAVARRLSELVREVDTVARFGGDEYGIVQADVTAAESAAVLAGKVREALTKPFLIGGNEVRVDTSIGITVAGKENSDPVLLMEEADRALYRVKEHGRGDYAFHTPELTESIHRQIMIAGELERALGQRELAVLFQPQVDLATGRVVGAEALLRWRHPTRGLLLPGAFLAVAENHGYIRRIGDWVLGEVAAQMERWRKLGLAFGPVSVNLAAAQFRDETFAGRVLDLLQDTGAEPVMLELELGEGLLQRSDRMLTSNLEALSEAGIGLVVDDFGTGFSSLLRLKELDVRRIKVAQQFVLGMLDDGTAREMAAVTLAIARSLGMATIAEAIERQEHVDALRVLGCEVGQGFYFSPALAPDAFVQLVAARNG